MLHHLKGDPIPENYEQKKALLAKHHIALWDYYESAIRPDSSNDKDIKDGHPNDIAAFLSQHPTIKVIAINGFDKDRTFGDKIRKSIADIPALSDVRVIGLPETSGGNANYGWGDLDNLARAWNQIFSTT